MCPDPGPPLDPRAYDILLVYSVSFLKRPSSFVHDKDWFRLHMRTRLLSDKQKTTKKKQKKKKKEKKKETKKKKENNIENVKSQIKNHEYRAI